MTNTQLAILLANIWLARYAGPQYSMCMALLFLFVGIYCGWIE